MQNEPASDAAVEGLERAKLLDSESERLSDELSEGAWSDAARRGRVNMRQDISIQHQSKHESNVQASRSRGLALGAS